MVDTCAAEFEAKTPYFYSTFDQENESIPSDKKKIIVLGSGPNRIGQGIDFDYCCVHGLLAIKDAGFTNYSLFRRGTQIVGYYEVEPDAATAFAKLGKAESNARWAKWFEEVIVNLTDNKGNLMEMTEVWHLD